ncbi:MAG: hypothetical protein KZY74_18470 [Paenibacillaceae bacterium]|uniref:Uncharacterized protein n=1 Tax=Paenibacillus mellifer TaxID=2937794 RepID=A0A9X1Y185_9BACL|nr:hypothetical protein [Paenibacillus mellifer]MBW4841379.1 hypothetical protein [Paenibacillaceae bacterium]MCK8487766.1 hypothetical protein [Paenibacillus mellifer]
MRRSSITVGMAVMAIVLFTAIVCSQLFGATTASAHMGQHQGWHDAFRYEQHGMPMMPSDSRAEASAKPLWPILLHLALLIGGAALFVKASGLMKWAGAVFAVISAMSLLTPLWGLIVVILGYFLYRKWTSHHPQPYANSQESIVIPYPIDIGQNRGRFLDEWERKQYKEEE